MKQITEYFSKEKTSSMPIDEYLSTKVVKPLARNFRDEFPNKPKFDEVKSFLIDHGFKEYNLRRIKYSEFADLIERRFGIYESSNYNEVTICDKGKTTEDNPEFTLYATDDGSLFFAENHSSGEKFIAKEETYTMILQLFNTYEEFLDRINDHISWNDY